MVKFLVVFSKLPDPTRAGASPSNRTYSIFVQFRNASLDIAVTLLGKITDVKDVHELKEDWPMKASCLPNFNSVRLRHPQKANESIVVRLSGRRSFFKLTQE